MRKVRILFTRNIIPVLKYILKSLDYFEKPYEKHLKTLIFCINSYQCLNFTGDYRFCCISNRNNVYLICMFIDIECCLTTVPSTETRNKVESTTFSRDNLWWSARI